MILEERGRRRVQKRKAYDDDDNQGTSLPKASQRTKIEASTKRVTRSMSRNPTEERQEGIGHTSSTSASSPITKAGKTWTPWGEARIVEVVIPVIKSLKSSTQTRKNDNPTTTNRSRTSASSTKVIIGIDDPDSSNDSDINSTRGSTRTVSSGHFSFEDKPAEPISLDSSVLKTNASPTRDFPKVLDARMDSKPTFRCGLQSIAGYTGCYKRRRHDDINQVLVTLWAAGCPKPLTINKTTQFQDVYIAEFNRKEWNEMKDPNMKEIERPRFVYFDGLPLPFEQLKVIKDCSKLVAVKPVEAWQDEGIKAIKEKMKRA